jgi:hypothetical protein
MMPSMNFFELLGVSSDQLADSMPEVIVEVGAGGCGGGGGAGGVGSNCAALAAPPQPARCRGSAGRSPAGPPLTSPRAQSVLPAPRPIPRQAFHKGGKEAVRDVVYKEVALRLRCPIIVRSAEPGGDEVTYGDDSLPGAPVFLVKDARDLFTRVNEDGTPYAMPPPPLPAREDGGAGYGGAAAAPRPRKPRPAGAAGGGGGGGGGQTARDRERDATWEVRWGGGRWRRSGRGGGESEACSATILCQRVRSGPWPDASSIQLKPDPRGPDAPHIPHSPPPHPRTPPSG